jgi:hypothetical protein
VLRDHLRELSDPDGARVLLVTGASGLGKSHSWHLISYIGDRVGRYAAHRVDLADWTGPKLSARQLMAEMFADLGWKPAEVDSAAQPDTVVRLLISAFKNRVRSLPRPVCLVFDGFTSRTSDEFARRFVVSMADAVNEDQSLDARVVLLEVEAPCRPTWRPTRCRKPSAPVSRTTCRPSSRRPLPQSANVSATAPCGS